MFLYIVIPSAALLTIRDSLFDVKTTILQSTVWLGTTNVMIYFIYLLWSDTAVALKIRPERVNN